MKRSHLVHVVLACGLLATSAPLFAQPTPVPTPTPAPTMPDWFTGNASLLLLGRDNVDSSKFQEYREIAKGVSLPTFSLQGRQEGTDFALFGQNVARSDQRYFGFANVGLVGVTFDYNQIPHNLGNDGRIIHAEANGGDWTMNATTRAALGAAVDAVPAASRNYAFYSNLLAPTTASAGFVDLSGERKRGDVGVTLPYGLSVTYLREVKTGYRGASGGDILGVVTTAIDVPEPMNEVTQDFGVRWAYDFAGGNAYATFNRNLYNDRQDGYIIDNPFRATDLAYVSTAVPGGPASARFSSAPDNEASRGSFGGQIKLARRTRIAANLAIGRWTQDAAFLPFTINSAIRTTTGVAANNLSALPQQSLDGKINTTTFNVNFVSRPLDPLFVRMRYRLYDLENKTTPISWLAGSTSGDPERTWATETATADAPYGFATANLYDNSTKRFDAQVGYDIGDLTVEGSLRFASLERTSREALSGDENGWGLAAVYRTTDWLNVRAVFEDLSRSAEGETLYGFQPDEADRDLTRTGLQVNVSPFAAFGVGFSYFRRNVDYPDRPDRIAVSQGNPVPGAQPIPGTPSGLLEANYDSFTLDFDYTPSERAQVNAYYTWEKDTSTNQWSTTTGTALNNLLNYAGENRGDTFGANAVVHVVPEKWTLSMLLRHQNVDGFMDITAREAGSFYTPGRTTVIPPGTGGAADMTDYDDTEMTTLVLDVAYTLAQAWTFSVGYAYDRFDFSDAFSDGTTMFPQSVLFFMKQNDRGYTANLGYARLSYRF